MKNKLIIDEFNKLIKQKKWELTHANDRQEKIHKSYSIDRTKKALDEIKKFKKEIKTEDHLKELGEIKGIGKKTIERVREIIKKGKLSEIVDYADSEVYDKASNDLEQVIGIGKSKAHELITKHNIKSVNQLIELNKQGKIKLNDKILLGLKYHGVYKQEIPRMEIVKIDKFLYKIYKRIDPSLLGVICGSYRREKAYSGDIDILITHPKIKTMKQLKAQKGNYLKRLVAYLKKISFLVDDMTDKNVVTKYMGFCKYKNNPPWRIDFRYIPYESYYTALLYFTGSGQFNTRIREVAITLGYKLSEYGLYEVDENREVTKKLKINSEKEIFDILGLEYLTPKQRNY